jgi:RHS repeat-associated protein
MVNRIVSRLRVGACLLGLFSFVFAMAQTPPPGADDDSFPFAILIKALTPVCSAFTAAPASVLSGGNVALAATCTNLPTTYEWYRGTTLLGTTTTATFSSAAPATVATYEYAVIAKRGNISSLRKAANVSVIAVPPLSVSTVTNTTVNTPVSIQGTFNAPANSANVRVSVGSNLVANLTNVAGNFSASWTPTQSGVYQIRVEAVNNSTLQVLATNLTKVVVADVPAATAMTIPGNSSAGATAGGFGVSDMGGAQYSIPISIPPGIAGMQPSISLGYSNTGGNGHVGVGWAIGGLSAISRCPKTIAQDGARSGINYDNNAENDAYCLSGQRLYEISRRNGTDPKWGAITIIEYRTEIDSFSRIESYTNTPTFVGPLAFRVYSKSGQIMDYGSRWWAINEGISQIASDPSRVNTVRTWPLDRVLDRNGNYYAIDYSGTRAGQSVPVSLTATNAIAPVGAFPAGELYPTQITYTLRDSAPNVSQVNRVLFRYEDRPANDRHVMFDSGAGQFVLSKRLRAVESYVDGGLASEPGVYPVYPKCDENSGGGCGALVRRYSLAYDPAPATNRSRLISVEECAADGVCLPKTTFAWTGFTKNLTGTGSRVISVGGTDISNFEQFRAADINGDGRTDLYRRYGSGSSNPTSPDRGHIQALISQPDGSFIERRIYATAGEVAGPVDTTVYALDMNGDGRADFFSINNATSYMRICITNESATAFNCSSPQDQGIGAPDRSIFYQGDFDGDGKIDLLFYRSTAVVGTTTMHKWDLIRGTNTGFSSAPQVLYTPYYSEYGAGGAGKFDPATGSVGDFNGDGRADLYMLKIPSTCNIGTGTPIPGPCGYPNAVISAQILLSRSINGQTAFEWTPTEIGIVLPRSGYGLLDSTVDFNGDGVADTMNQDLNLCLSAGDGSFGSYETMPATTPAPGYTAASMCKTPKADIQGASLPTEWLGNLNFKDIIFGDFDGDGRTDMMLKKPNSIASVCLSRTGSASSPSVGNNVYFECSDWPLQTNEAIKNIKAGDFNGDGKTDLIASNGGAGLVLSLAGDATGTTAPRTLSDQIVRITSGLGAYTDIVYAPITDSSVYTKGTGQTGNRIDIQSPMYVVKSTASSNGIGGTFDTTYKYESLIGQTDGRGLMGFGKRSVTHNNGEAIVRTEMTYEQEWWKAGHIKTVRKYIVGVPVNGVPTDVLVNEAVNTYDWKQNVPYAKVNQVYLINTIEKSWNINKTGGLEALPFTVTETPLANIDQYGNVGRVTATSYEPATASAPNGTANGYSKVTVNTFDAEDPTNWILGRLSTASVTHNMPGRTGIQRNSSFDYYATNGQLKTERVEPNSGNLDERLTTTYTYGDPFGQRTKTSVDFYENGTLKTRSSTTAYTADGRFVASMTNAYNQTVSYTGYDRRFGAVISSSGINGLTGKTYYDAFGRKVGEELKDSADNRLAMSIMTYSPFPNASSPTGVIVNTKNHTGSESQVQADSLGREVSSSARRFDGTSVASITTYDAFGRKAWVSGPRGGTSGTGATSAYLTTTFEYDKLARPTVQVIRAGKNTPLGTEQTRTTTEYGVQAVGTTTYSLLTAIQSGAQYAGATATHTIVKYTDSQGRTFKITDNAAKDTTYGYDPLGNLENVTGPGAISETMTYDVRGRKKSSTNANIAGKYIYVYNGAGELIQQTDPKLQTTTMTYDLLGRMVSRTENGSFAFVSAWTYDNSASGPSAGKLLSNSASGTTHAFIYDAQSRLTQTNSTIVGKTYNRYTLYNAQGQVSYVGYPDSANDIAPFGVRHSYNAYGYATTVARQDNPAEIYWTTTGRFDDGSLATANHGGAFYEKDYDTLGRQSAIRLKQINNTVAQSSAYSYDAIGNVLLRAQNYTAAPANNYAENFCYDKLNRVTSSSTVTGCGSPQFTYSDDGNLTSKGGTTGNIGIITYGTTARTNGAGPHAVASANGKTYAYDENGNFIYYKPYTDANGNRTSYVDYLPFNLPRSITGNNTNISGLSTVSLLVYDYDADHTRITEQVYSGPNAGSSTIYVGPGFFEVANNANGTKEYRHYIGGPDGTIGIRTVAVDASNNVLTSAAGQGQTTRYWFKDHLGSPASEYDVGAVNLTPLGFDTWGLRRKNTSANNFTQSLSTADLASYQSPRGYTGHEHLDDVGLIHMNGRIYDPMIGRFLQPDPIISEPYNSQNFNRYAYVLNNPLMYTDPSGYSTWTEVRGPVVAIIVAVVTYNAGMAFAMEGTVGVMAPEYIAAAETYSSIAAGFASGGVAGGNIESAIAGAFSGGALSAVGSAYAAGTIGVAEKIVAHAIIGCIGGGMNGGSCGAGAASGGFAAAAGAALKMNGLQDWDNRFTRAIIGGVSARLAGGKFANGAFTATFNYLLNDVIPSHQKSTIEVNQLAGEALEEKQAALLAEKQIAFERRVAVSLVHDGKVVTAVADFVYWLDGKLIFLEIKYGDHAKLSEGQKLVYKAAIESGNVSIVSADRAAKLGVGAGETLAKQGLKTTASLVASAGGRATRQWLRYVGSGLAVIGSNAVIALDFSTTSGTAHAMEMPNPNNAAYSPSK